MIWIGCDHAGFQLKDFLLLSLENSTEFQKLGPVKDLGTFSLDSVDYADIVVEAQQELMQAKLSVPEAKTGEKYFVILICSTGQGMAMAANKVFDERAALCWNEESARLARAHNDAQILCLGQNWQAPDVALSVVKTFLTTEFEGGRHDRRIQKIYHSK